MSKRCYIAIDLKSFYASVECVERGLDPLNTNLVVADISRTQKTICLAVSPSLKAYGISGRARLFELVQRVDELNNARARDSADGKLSGSSCDAGVLAAYPDIAIDYIVACPQMSNYVAKSTEIYQIYLRHVAPEDIHVYSIDEVFIDVSGYLKTSHMDAHAFALMLVREVLAQTGITATAGIGSNLYLAKVAMDIVAKHVQPDADGVRIAELDEMSYRRLLWDHRPLTDFWRVGVGYTRKLEECGIWTMGDVARASLHGPETLHNEELLYELFGVNAQLLIDHAWGWEPATMADIKAYKPETTSLSTAQVLTKPYAHDVARLVICEMAEQLSYDLLEKRLVSDTFVITVGYDKENFKKAKACGAELTLDRFGRKIPKHAHGTKHLERKTSSARLVREGVLALFDSIVDPQFSVRRINVTACDTVSEDEAASYAPQDEQLDLFCDVQAKDEANRQLDARLAVERKSSEAVLEVRHKFGKNALIKGINLLEGATQRDRNKRIGGHRV